MKREQWIQNEIIQWQREGIIQEEVAHQLYQRYQDYSPEGKPVTALAVVGSLLLGAGVILIGARNWPLIPLWLKGVLSLIPLLCAQLLCFYTLLYHKQSRAWRESAAILLTCTVFSSMAMIGQTFHLSDDIDIYLLVCGLLSGPAICIMKSSSPIIIYYGSILTWGSYNLDGWYGIVIMSVLLCAGVIYVWERCRRSDGGATGYLVAVSAISCLIATLMWAGQCEASGALFLGAYALLAFCLGNYAPVRAKALLPIAAGAGLVALIYLTYTNPWRYPSLGPGAGGVISVLLVAALLVVTLCFGIKSFRNDQPSMGILIVSAAACGIRQGWSLFGWAEQEALFAALFNVFVLLIGALLIVQSFHSCRASWGNTGVLFICLLILLRFFDSGMGFLGRGVACLALGAVFLLANRAISRQIKERETANATDQA